MDVLLPLIVVAGVALLTFVRGSIRIVQEYERGVIFRLGRAVGARGPGLFILLPFVERMHKVDLRTVTLDVPSQESITRDNVTLRINAVVYFRVIDPVAAVVNIANYLVATSQIAQTTLRNVIGQVELDQLLSERDDINTRLQAIIDDATEPWGIKVSLVEVKDVELPEVMKRAMARQAEAEREKRAKMIHAEGEYQAATQLAHAANVMNTAPNALQLRYLQTLTEISVEQNSTIIFPVPIDFLKAFMDTQAPKMPSTPTRATPPTDQRFDRETGRPIESAGERQLVGDGQ